MDRPVIKALKTFNGGYTAKIYIGGKHVAFAEDRGDGGAPRLTPTGVMHQREVEAALAAIEVPTWFLGEMEPYWEWGLSLLVNEYEWRRWARKDGVVVTRRASRYAHDGMEQEVVAIRTTSKMTPYFDGSVWHEA